MKYRLLTLLIFFVTSVVVQAEEPALPAGLFDSAPKINDKTTESTEGIFEEVGFSGFVEGRAGVRLQNDNTQKAASIGELRSQNSFDTAWSDYSAELTFDLVADPVADDWPVDLESGKGFLDLRGASLVARPLDFMDLSVGRQVLTWGTGDYIFINDLFPKDWNSFFNGRDDEYLKAPSDAVKLSLFSDFINLNFVYTPRFDSDRFIDGHRISFFNQGAGRVTGRDLLVQTDQRSSWFNEDEIALRLYRQLSGYEVAAYGYFGYWKSPEGSDPLRGLAFFPRLNVYGASARGPLFGGLANIEAGYYDSLDDSSGTMPTIRNSETRLLLGYEKELLTDFSGSIQYYLEHMDDYSNYKAALPQTALVVKDRDRHLITLRLTKMMLDQNLRLTLFSFVSPSDQDGYSRISANYKLSDNWQAEAGANFFYGSNQRTFFGQFEDNSNFYLSARYSFVH